MCINPEMCLYTPQSRQGQQDKEKSSKKIRNFGPSKPHWGKNAIFWGFWMRGGWWEGVWGHGDSTGTNSSIPIPQPRNWLGIWGFPSNFPIFPFVLFPNHSCISSSNSAADWGLGATQNWFYIQPLLQVNPTFLLDILLKILIFRVLFRTTSQPNRLKTKEKSILPPWHFCAKDFWLFGEDKIQWNRSVQLKKKHLEPFTHTKEILWIFQDFFFFLPGNFLKSKIKRGKVGFSY